jgi:hypothetical protein
MRRFFSLALLAFGLVVFSSAFSADEPTRIEQSMSKEEFKSAGLDKLSAEELAALNAWLNRDRVATVKKVKEEEKKDRSEGLGRAGDVDRVSVQSKVLGTFLGWRGNTAFELENGQIWIQSEAGELVAKKKQGVMVTITPGAFGSWFLQAEGYNSSVRVKRVK